MNSLFGREIMQLHPQGFVGLGDFNAASVALGSLVSPTERLDVLDGRARIRQLPTELEMDSVDQFVVVNANGVLGWRNANAATGADCDWAFSGGANGRNVVTAHLPLTSLTCPNVANHVGIGTTTMPAKLTVLETGTTAGTEYGMHVLMNGNTGDNLGMAMRVRGLELGGSAIIQNSNADGLRSPANGLQEGDTYTICVRM